MLFSSRSREQQSKIPEIHNGTPSAGGDETIAPSAFEERMRQMEESRTREGLERPEYCRSPFEAGRLREGIPQVTVYTDTHFAGQQWSGEGYEGLTSGKRQFFGLAKIPYVRDGARILDVMSNVAMRLIRPEVINRFNAGGEVVNLGDFVDATEAGAAINTYARYERYLRGSQQESGGEANAVRLIQIPGNHNAFTGPDKKLGYDPIAKTHGVLDIETFREIAGKIKEGYSWEAVSKAYNESHRGEKAAIHPAMKWYLEQITYGSSIGRFKEHRTAADGEEDIQVAFLNSELARPGSRPQDLEAALTELGIAGNDSLHQEMMDKINSEVSAQKALLEVTIEDCERGAKTVVYTHNGEAMQKQLIDCYQARILRRP